MGRSLGGDSHLLILDRILLIIWANIGNKYVTNQVITFIIIRYIINIRILWLKLSLISSHRKLLILNKGKSPDHEENGNEINADQVLDGLSAYEIDRLMTKVVKVGDRATVNTSKNSGRCILPNNTDITFPILCLLCSLPHSLFIYNI